MKAPATPSYALQVSVGSLRTLPLEELEQVARCIVFVAAPQPPRVGASIDLVLEVERDAPVTVPAMVVWSRPGRPGTPAGFRAQLKAAPAGLPDRLRDLAERAYAEGAPRQVESSRVPGGLVIEERVSSKEVTSPMRSAPRAPATIPPPAPPSLPPLPRSVAPPSAWVSPPSMPPSRPPVITVAAPDLALDLISREANYASIPPPVGADAQTKRHRAVPTTTTPVTVRFSSHRNYLLHFEQFLEHGLVYVQGAQNLNVGAVVTLLIEVPDGDAALELLATIERAIEPPEVPDSGWVARFDDAEGTAAERFATASFIVATPHGA